MARIIIFSGAGISAESGVQTFRDKDGLWEGHDIDEVCNYQTWQRNYDAVHRFYDERRVALATVTPNDAHQLIADWERRYEVINVTQNIDDLFERAGCRDVIHLHGFLTEMRCYECDRRWDIGYRRHDTTLCPDAAQHHTLLKPSVVFFGEQAPLYQRLYTIFEDLADDDLIFVIGTSDAVVPFGHYLRHLPGRKFRVNPDPEYSDVYEREFTSTACAAVAEMDALVRAHMGG